jgi:hypothetical protein
MGNVLCGHAAFAAVQVSTGQGTKLRSKQLNNNPSTSSSTISLIAASAGGCKDEVEVALCAARSELDAGLHRSISDDYILGKIIGHGAYCKVHSCTQIGTDQEFAVKAVAKDEDNPKQREGGFPGMLHVVLPS